MAGPLRNCAPSELLASSGAKPATVVTVVSKIGRKRLAVASFIAVKKSLPSASNWLSVETRTRLLFVNTPMSAMVPMIEKTLSDSPWIQWPKITPMKAKGYSENVISA